MLRPGIFFFAAGLTAAVPMAAGELSVRKRTEAGPTEMRQALDPKKTAIVVCDMWDKHWCQGATTRVDAMTRRMEPVLAAARAKGVLIIHAPSDTMTFYQDAPQRQAMLRIPKVAPAPVLDQKDVPPLPIDDSDGGCDTGETMYKAWKRQHPGLTIAPEDLVSDNGTEVYSALKQRGITQLLVMGVHTNMCILNRTFAIKQMTRWGVPCVLVRDLTDAMYDPKDKPFVSHDRGTGLVVEYIERYWAPTTTSADLLSALQ